ncbi:unnamed protein product [Boreogadus saida]
MDLRKGEGRERNQVKNYRLYSVPPSSRQPLLCRHQLQSVCVWRLKAGRCWREGDQRADLSVGWMEGQGSHHTGPQSVPGPFTAQAAAAYSVVWNRIDLWKVDRLDTQHRSLG